MLEDADKDRIAEIFEEIIIGALRDDRPRTFDVLREKSRNGAMLEDVDNDPAPSEPRPATEVTVRYWINQESRAAIGVCHTRFHMDDIMKLPAARGFDDRSRSCSKT